MSYLTKSDHNTINNALKNYAWPGGYPVFLVMRDGDTLCPACVRANLRLIVQGTHDRRLGWSSGWEAEAADINWEDPNLTCNNCGKRIESAYTDTE